MAFDLIVDQAGIAGYVGKAEKCTFEFSTPPEWVPGENWLANQVINSSVAKIREQGCELLRAKVWRDTSPLWLTNYRVELTATASPLWWNLVIVGVLAIAILVITWKILSVVKDIDWGKAALPVTAGAISVGLIAIIGILLLTGGKEKVREYGR